jgi:hypothetical protein
MPALTTEERRVIQLALEHYIAELARKQKRAIRRGDENELDRLTELGDLATITVIRRYDRNELERYARVPEVVDGPALTCGRSRTTRCSMSAAIIGQSAHVVRAFDQFERARTGKCGARRTKRLMDEIRKLRTILRVERT